MVKPTIIIASPHARNDALEGKVRERLRDYEVVRIRERGALSRETLEVLSPVWIFFPHWSWLICEEIHAHYRCVIFHMTDLPYGRGGSPLQNLIVRGHKDTQVSALRCESKMDAGPIYMKRPLTLDGTAEQILMRASDVMAGMIVDIVRDAPDPVPQSGEVVVFERRTPGDGDLSNVAALGQVYDFIRMLEADGYPRAFLEKGDLRVEFTEASLHDGCVEARAKITLNDSSPRVQTGKE